MYKILTLIAAAALMLASCGNDDLLTEDTPSAINDNSHLYIAPGTEDDDHDDPGEQGEFAGTLAGKLNNSYTGALKVVVDGEEASASQETIEIIRKDGTHIDFRLKNFLLSDGIDVMHVGTILVEDILLREENGIVCFEKKEDILISEGDIEGVELWLGPLLDLVPVVINGTVEGDIMTVNIDIDMESLGQIIHVEFAGDPSATDK